MAEYKLSHSAQEVDELLTKVKGGVCLPVVDCTACVSDEVITDTAVIAAMNQYSESPGIIVRGFLDVEGEKTEFCVHCNRLKNGTMTTFTAEFGDYIISVVGDNVGNWLYSVGG